MMTLPLSLSPLEVLLIPRTNKMAGVHSLHIVDRCFYHSGKKTAIVYFLPDFHFDWFINTLA